MYTFSGVEAGKMVRTHFPGEKRQRLTHFVDRKGHLKNSALLADATACLPASTNTWS